jgi:dCMP deaminase
MDDARPDWDDYWMEVAHVISKRGTCNRKRVGAVIVVENFIVSTGYNGAAPGEPHCDQVDHDLVELAGGTKNCVRAVHAEENALLQAARRGVAVRGGTIYTNTFPCWPCARKIMTAGLVRVVYNAPYNNDERVIKAFGRQSIKLERI